MARRLAILTRKRDGAPFRQRIAPYLEPLEARGIRCAVHELPSGVLARRRVCRDAARADAVLLHRKTLTAAEAWWLGEVRLIYDVDDAVMVQARRPDVAHTGRLRRWRRTVARADLVLAGNPLLAEQAREGGARQVEVVPTGLDTTRYAPKTDYAAGDAVRLVWIGSRSTLKQLAALRPTLEALGADRPDLVLRIIADASLDLARLPVEAVPWARETEAAHLAEADIGIAPLPDTAYTRGKCGFKVLQSMAAGLPVVASPVGVQAAYVRHDESGLVAEDTAAWLAAVERLAADAALRARLGRAGRKRVEREFDVSVLAPRVCAAVAGALDA